jgi:hypothetical protein
MQDHVPGTVRAPESLFDGHSAEEVLDALLGLVHFRITQVPASPELNELTLYSALACAFAPWAPATTADLHILRLVALAFARRGDVQQTRDYAEIAMQLSANRPASVRRLAWYTYADIYARIGNSVEAMTAAAFMLTLDAEVSSTDAWQELVLLVRLFRDFGLYEEARTFLDLAKQAQGEGHLPDGYSLRLNTLELQLDWASAMQEHQVERRSENSADTGASIPAPIGGASRGADESSAWVPMAH